jgi:signal transduction histidine kinase
MKTGLPQLFPHIQPAGRDVVPLLRLEQVRLVYDYLPVSQLVTVVNALIFVAVQSPVIEWPVLIGWLYVVCALALVRIMGGLAFRRAADQSHQLQRWRAYAIAGAAGSGIVWGAAAVFLFPPMEVAHQVFVAFMLGGMVAGSVTTLAPIFSAFVAFAALTLVPAVIRFTLEHGVIQYAMGWMTLVFLVAMILVARRSYNSLYDLLRLRFENSALVEELLATQEMLQRSYEGLEKRVAERTTELSQTNAELQRLAYVASHDLQEPLRNAANFALLLEARYRDRLDADGREFLQIIVSGVKHMRTLVDDLLSHSRVGAPPQLAPTDCAELVDKVLVNFRSAIAENGASVTRDALPVVQADTGKLEQVFNNLFSNAIKFRGKDPLRMHVGVKERPGEWVFTVQDNGIGIAPRYAEQIFEMFERLYSQAEYPGTGIGLAVCKKIVESHHGRIWVDSEEGSGAAFSFTLPRARGTGAAQVGSVASGRDPAGGGQPG